MRNSPIHFDGQTKKYETIGFLLFLCLFLYGWYKNGLSYYFLGKLSFVESCTPLLFLCISFCLSILLSFFTKTKISLRTFILGILVSILVPPNFPIWLFLLVSFFYFLFYFLLQKKFYTILFLPIYRIFVFFLSSFFSIGLENIIEQNNSYFYGTIDIFFGKGLGDIGTTHIFLIFLSYFIFQNYFYYKKELPIYAIATYFVSFFLVYFFNPNQFMIRDVLNSSFFFATVFLLPLNPVSPVLKKEKFFFGCGVGLFSFLFIHIFSIYEGVYFVLFLFQIIWNISLWMQKRGFFKRFNC